MVLTKDELIAALQQEVHILLHLAGKADQAQLEYRPTPKQRSTLELLQYLTFMGPAIIQASISGWDTAAWEKAEAEANGRSIDQTLAAIAAQKDEYARAIGAMSDADLRATTTNFDGQPISRGAFIVTWVLSGCAAYRTQLFCYLKACGREELGTSNLWMGVDPPPA